MHDNVITYDDFAKVSLRVGMVIKAETVEGSDKLVRLQVDLNEPVNEETGEKQYRQIVAGIGKVYTPEDLVDRLIVVVENLKPRKLMGLESQGMLLAADGPDGPVLLRPDGKVSPGTMVR
jgi:methionyl-tRNA synthetase